MGSGTCASFHSSFFLFLLVTLEVSFSSPTNLWEGRVTSEILFNSLEDFRGGFTVGYSKISY
jgi:hypothetical protein